MSRAYYDRTASEWRTAVDAVRAAGGDVITLPVNHLVIILLGYEHHQQERAKTLAWIGEAAENGQLAGDAVLRLRHKLGDLTDDQYADQMRDATRGEAR